MYLSIAGVGKTSLVTTSVHELLDKGISSIIVDCDPQRHATCSFMEDTEETQLQQQLKDGCKSDLTSSTEDEMSDETIGSDELKSNVDSSAVHNGPMPQPFAPIEYVTRFFPFTEHLTNNTCEIIKASVETSGKIQMKDDATWPIPTLTRSNGTQDAAIFLIPGDINLSGELEDHYSKTNTYNRNVKYGWLAR